MASRIDYSQNRKLYVGTTAELSVADGGVVVDNQLIIGGTSSSYMLDVSLSATIGSTNVGSNTTNFENKLVIAGKNNYSDGTTWYGDYGQILLSSTSNMTGSARQFLITNALDNNKFAIIRSVDAGTNPVTNSTGNGVNSGTADFVINNTGNVGIATTSPDYKFEVQGVISSADAGLQKATFANVGNDLVLTSNADATNVSASLIFKSSASGGGGVTEKMRISSDNSLVLGSSTVGGSKRFLMLSADNAVNYDIDFQQQGTANFGRIRYTEGASDLQFFPITGVDPNLTLKYNGSSYFSRGNVGINDTTNNAKLGINGGAVKIKNIVSSSPGSDVRRNINIATFDGQGSTFTGKLIIETPVMTTGAMATFKISGWQYDESWDLTVSGYLRFGTGRGWQQTGGAILTGNPPFDVDEVRLCYNDSTNIFYIILGTATTFWDYYASIVINADSYYQDSIPTTGWDMSVATADPTGLSSIVTLTNIAKYGSYDAVIPGYVSIGTTSSDGQLNVADGNAKMVFDGASSDRPYLQLRHDAVPVDGEELAIMDFSGFNDASQNTRYGIIIGKAEDVSDGTEDGSMNFLTMKAGTATNTMILRSGNVGMGGQTAPSQPLDVTGKIRLTDDIQLDSTSPRIDFDNGATGSLRFFSTSANATKMSITSGGEVTLNAYDSTNQVGTPTYLLGVRSDGQIVKTNTGATKGTQVHSLAATGGTASWKKIGTFTAAHGGQSAFIKIVTNNGYNSSVGQNLEVYIRFKTSNGGSLDGNGFSGDSGFYTIGYNASIPSGNIKWVSNAGGTSATSYALYVNIPAYSGNGGFYVVENSVGTWLNNMSNASDPGAASATVMIPGESFRVGSTDFVVNGGGGDAYFANSNVGIGTTGPSANLEIFKSSGPSLLLTAGGSGTAGFKITKGDSGTAYINNVDNVGMQFQIANGTKMTIASSGDVGIGETSPDQKLNVREDGGGDTFRGIEVHNNSQSDARAGICFKAYDWVQSAIWHGRTGTAAYAGALVLGTNPNTTDLTVSGVTGRMWIVNSGRIGIGTNNPGTKVDIQDVEANIDGLRVSGNATVGQSYGIRINAGTSLNDYALAVANQANSALFRVRGDGNVGVNDTSPSHKFDVNGDIRGSQYWLRGNANNPTSTTASIYDQANVGLTLSAHNVSIRNYNNSTSAMMESARFINTSLTVAGDVIAYGSPSDVRLKENIKPIESALDKAMKLQGVTFDWKQKEDSILELKEDIGFIAQDVQKVVPELVRENKDGMLSMRHQGIAPILLEAIKELKAEIDLLKSKPCTCNKCNCNI